MAIINGALFKLVIYKAVDFVVFGRSSCPKISQTKAWAFSREKKKKEIVGILKLVLKLLFSELLTATERGLNFDI